MWTNFPIFGGLDDRSSIAFDSERLVNMFMIGDRQGKKKLAFLGAPGLNQELVVQNGTAISRALFTYQNNMFGVFGSDVYRFTPPLVKAKIGTLGTTQGFVSISANNAGQVLFIDGQAGYVYDINAGTFTQVTASGFPSMPTNGVFLDGYLVVPDFDTRQFNISGPNDALAWDTLDFAQIQAYPGTLVGVGVVNRRLYFFKTDSTEVWFNTGASDFPFRRDNNLLFNFGCLAASSIVSGFGYLFWLARDSDGVGSIMMTQGQTARRISNESIEDTIEQMTDPSDVSAYIYKDLGHIFLVMTWNTDDITLVYDVMMDYWGSYEMVPTLANPNVPNSGKTRHLSNCHAFFNDKHYVGSYKGPVLYEMNRNYATNAGEVIRRIRVCPHFFDENYRMMQIQHIQLDMQMGLGLSGSGGTDFWVDDEADNIIDQGANNLVFNEGGDYATDPKVYLRISRDGGNTFGNYHPASVGKIGNRRARAIWRRLGLCRDLVAEFSFVDPVLPVSMLGASIKYEVLPK